MSVVGVHFLVLLSGSSARCWCSLCCPDPPLICRVPGVQRPLQQFPPSHTLRWVQETNLAPHREQSAGRTREDK